MKEAIASLGRQKSIQPPSWVNLIDLPPIRVGDIGLNYEQVSAVLLALQRSSLSSPRNLITALKTHAQPKSLDAFACKLFDLWRQEDSPTQHKWAMFALGLLGSVGAAIKLAPLIITWRSELKHQRVTWGLDCLKAMGTDTALMQLNGIAQKTRHPNLRERALENLADVARQRQITQEQLEDRIVSNCGLNTQGKTTFNFGARQFEFVLGADMQPLVRDEKGKLLANLPKPSKKDDLDFANQSIENWKLLKKQITQVVKIQTARLEQMMVTERRWSKEEFELWLVNHPLMTYFVQRLVWAGYDAQNQIITTFRVAEDHTYTDINDNLFNLDGTTNIGLVHPLHLTSEVREKWRLLWSDYELMAPFPQLDREIFFPTPTEEYQTIVTRFKDIAVPGITLVGTFEKQGWLRGGAGDGGGCTKHAKHFSTANLIAHIEYSGGIAMWDVRDSTEIKITQCYFTPLNYNSGSMLGSSYQRALPLSEVNKIVLREVMRDLTHLTQKFVQ